MASLLRFRERTTTERIHLPDGSVRLVKIMVNDRHDVQHVEDGDRLHATGMPAPFAITVQRASKQRRGLLLRGMGMPKIRQAFSRDIVPGLWAPLEGWGPQT